MHKKLIPLTVVLVALLAVFYGCASNGNTTNHPALNSDPTTVVTTTVPTTQPTTQSVTPTIPTTQPTTTPTTVPATTATTKLTESATASTTKGNGKYTIYYNGKFAEGDNEGANHRNFNVFREAYNFADQIGRSGVDPNVLLQNNWDGSRMKWDVDGQSMYWASGAQ